jgi:hypothetical protein
MKKTAAKKFNKNSTLGDILKKSEAEEVLAKFGVPCLSCPMAEFEISELKIGEVCKTYGIGLDKLLAELNKKIDF